jgi:hypothetical protein
VPQLLVRSVRVKGVCEALGACVADGGTYSGVMHLMGQARTETQASFPLGGVAATGTVALQGTPLPRPDATLLEPNRAQPVSLQPHQGLVSTSIGSSLNRRGHPLPWRKLTCMGVLQPYCNRASTG